MLPNRSSNRYTSTQRADIVRSYNAGLTYGQIASLTGLSRSRVAGVVRTAARRGQVPGYGERS